MDRRKRTARTVALMSLFSMTDVQENVPVASFIGDGSDLVSLIVGIEPVQAGSGDPSPDNIRPISGWTGANIYVSQTTDAEDGATYTITFPTSAGTVYGGTLDVTAGKLTVDRTMLDMSSITDWTLDRNAKRIYKVRSDLAPASAASVVADGLICNRFPSITANAIYSNTQGVALSVGSALQFHINGLTDDANVTLAMVNAYFANNSTIVVAKLATPIVYNLTPTEINTLLGTNNIWADTGEIKYIEYNV